MVTALLVPFFLLWQTAAFSQPREWAIGVDVVDQIELQEIVETAAERIVRLLQRRGLRETTRRSMS